MPEPIIPPLYRTARIAIGIGIVSTALGVLYALSVLLNSVFAIRELPQGADVLDTLTAPTDTPMLPPTAVTPPTLSTPGLVVPEGSYSFIIAGNDYRPNRPPACPDCYLKYTDAFVYLNVVLDQPNPHATMVSIPRELYLHVDGIEPDSRVNQLYTHGGVEYIHLWAETILEVEIDGVIVIEMDKFARIVDDLGGIDIVAPETFSDKCGSEWYDYIEGEAYHLDGFDALCYTRMRQYNPRGYFARQERHLDVLQALFDQVIEGFRTDPLVTAVKFVSTYYENVESDMSPELTARIVGESALSYILSSDVPEVRMYSISADRLELYPRVNKNSPYLYKPAFVISEWLRCITQNENGTDC